MMIKVILDFFKKYLFRFISIKLFGHVVGGVYGFILDKVISKAVIPFVNKMLIEGKLVFDKELGKIKAKELKKAKDENNEADYNTISDNIFN